MLQKRKKSYLAQATASFVFGGIFLFSTLIGHATTWEWDPSLSSMGGSDRTGTTNDTWTQSGGASNWYNTSGGTEPATYTGTTSDTVVFGSASTPTGAYTVTLVSGTVNVGAINFGTANANANYVIEKGTINGPSGGTLYIENAGIGTNTFGASGAAITFTGASTIEFTGSPTAGLGNQVTIGYTNFGAANLQLGNGSDYGSVSDGQPFSGTGTVTVEQGWNFNIAPKGRNNSANFILGSMGNGNGVVGANAAELGGLSMGGGSYSGDNYSGTIKLVSDSSITTAAENGNNAVQPSYVTASISGSANLYLGYSVLGAITTSNAGNNTLVLGGGSTTSTNTGAVIAFNTTNKGDTTTANGGVVGEAIALGQNNGISTTATLILGQTGSVAESNSVSAPNSVSSTINWTASDGAFDMEGYSQTLQGILVGGVGQGAGGTNALVQSNNRIFNNGTGTSVLTIDGTSGNTVAGNAGFGGVIEDSRQINTSGVVTANANGGKVEVVVDSGGVLKLSGANTYTGGTVVQNGGLLEVGTSSPNTGTTNSIVGTFGAATGTLSLNNGGTVDLSGQSETVGSASFNNDAAGTANSTITNTGTSPSTLTATNGVTVSSGATGTIGSATGSSTTVTGGATVQGTGTLNIAAQGSLDTLSVNATGMANVSGSVTSADTFGTITALGGGSIATTMVENGGVVQASGGNTTTHVANVGAVTLKSGSSLVADSSGGQGTLTASSVTVTGPTTWTFTLNSAGLNTSSNINDLGTFADTFGSDAVTVNLSGGNTGVPGGTMYLLMQATNNLTSADFQIGQNNTVFNTDGMLEVINNDLYFEVFSVPEPSTWLLLFSGMGVLVFWKFRARRS